MQTVYGRGKKLSKPKTQKKNWKKNKTNGIRNPFLLKVKKKKRKKNYR